VDRQGVCPMFRRLLITGLILGSLGLMLTQLRGQERVTPKEARGGEKEGEPWAEVPETFRGLKIPDWPVPTDLKRWQEVDRAKTRAAGLHCVGEMPPGPARKKVKVVSKEEFDAYTRGLFVFHNGVDRVVPAILLLRKNRRGRVPAVIGLHGHGSSKESI